ncbi:MAG: hypothetical protein E6I51_11900 [Chloroflexi bacterium]|nr:MAG: hypothetical protein E6I51_11900 [Chloroflexota bacterium]
MEDPSPPRRRRHGLARTGGRRATREAGGRDREVRPGEGRLDHEAANLLLLADPGYDGTRIEARRGALRVRALRGPGSLALDGPVGSPVTLLPVAGDAERVRTVGLRYPLAAETLRFGRARGLSNEIAASPASVSFENGTLLIFESPQGGAT